MAKDTHCARCGLVDHHWPGCPAIGTDDRTVLPGCDGKVSR